MLSRVDLVVSLLLAPQADGEVGRHARHPCDRVRPAADRTPTIERAGAGFLGDVGRRLAVAEQTKCRAVRGLMQLGKRIVELHEDDRDRFGRRVWAHRGNLHDPQLDDTHHTFSKRRVAIALTTEVSVRIAPSRGCPS